MKRDPLEVSCPAPLPENDLVLMAHGGGGRLMHQLLERVVFSQFSNEHLLNQHDSSVLEIGGLRLAFTTDSYVVNPLFFPGGDIGKLAVCGTINDLAMSGARPLYLSLALIIEEGLSVESLESVMSSISKTASECNVEIVTGDTKVVDRGKGDGIFINTAGIGIIEHRLDITPKHVMPSDSIILSGDIGRHGISVLAKREGLKFETDIESDCAPLHREILHLLKSGVQFHCLRDLTRGGLASALVEISQSANLSLEIDETIIPVSESVRAACELLGFDPLHVANEGRFIAFVPSNQAQQGLQLLKQFSPNNNPVQIGKVGSDSNALVTMKTVIGADRRIEMLSGEQLPRIC